MSNPLPQRRMQRPATPCNNILAPTKPIERFLRSRNELTQRQRNAIEFLLQGLSDQEAAAQVGVDRTTIFRWRKSIAFARELDRQRQLRSERAANQLQSMVPSALSILRQQLESDDPQQRMRAVSVLLRFATPGRLAPRAPTTAASPSAPSAARPAPPPRPPRSSAEAAARAQEMREIEDLIAYVEAPLPGQPGAPENLPDDLPDDLDDGDDLTDEDLEDEDEAEDEQQ